MDHRQYSSLFDALQNIPDPRQARGKQWEWPFILGVITAAMLNHQWAISAIAQWTQYHAATLIAAFQPARGRVPSEATLRRALRHVDVAQLEHHLSALAAATLGEPSSEPPLQGYAIDGGAPLAPVWIASRNQRRKYVIIAVKHEETNEGVLFSAYV